MKIAALLGIAFIAFLIKPINACTDFRLTAKDGTILITRSMEFGTDMKSNLRSSPQERLISNTTPNGKPGLSWKAKYGYLYLDGMNIDTALDGMNEAGLSMEALYLPGEAEYQDIPVDAENQAFSYVHLGDWILGNFQTVEEVKQALPKVYVYPEKITGLGKTIFPLHFIVNDASGKSIVIEYVDGKLHIYDDVIGVATNSPTYDWHITNLRNYLNLSAVSPKPVTIDGITLTTTGQGSGMKGLPGDASPPSRFVKIAMLQATVIPANDMVGAMNLAEHMINTVDLPIGFVRGIPGNSTTHDYTQWVIFKDLTHKVLYFRTYGNMTLRSVSLTKIDFSKNAKPLKMRLDNQAYVQDVTNTFLKQE